MAETSSYILEPPDTFSCSNCSTSLTMQGGAVNEIHIYSATNDFEKSVTILDAFVEIFGLTTTANTTTAEINILKQAVDSGVTLLMCCKCAEVVSLLYKDFLNLNQMSAATAYVTKLLSHLEAWRKKSDSLFVEDEEIVNGENNLHLLGSINSIEDVDYTIPVHNSNYLYEPDEGGEDYRVSDDALDSDDADQLLSKNHKIRKPLNSSLKLGKSSTEIQKKYTKKKSTNHLRTGVPGGQNRFFYTCPLCPKTFLLNWELHEHTLLIHKEKQIDTCGVCGLEYFPEVLNIKTHSCQHRMKRLASCLGPYACQICGLEFRTEKVLKYHKDGFHILDSVKFECVVCHRNLIRRSSLLQHYALQHLEGDNRQHHCIQCGMRFDNESELGKHTTTAHLKDREENPEVCEKCGKGFFDRVGKMAHMRNVHGIRRKQLDKSNFPCDICGKEFLQPKKLRAHQKFKHGSEEAKKYQCIICAKRFWTRHKVKSHMGIHTHGSNANTKIPKEFEQYNLHYKCKYCPVTFDYKAHMDLHNRNFHGAEEPFLCDVCQKSFPTHIEVLLHKRKHLSKEERKANPWNAKGVDGDFNCEKCGTSYNSLKNLFTHHNFVHFENSKVTCELCQKELRARSLNLHYKAFHPEKYVKEVKKPKKPPKPQNLKVDESDLKCDVCNNGKIYSTKHTLTEHKTMHGGTYLRVICPTCGKSLRSNSKLKLHNKTHHTSVSKAQVVLVVADNGIEKFICPICNNGKAYASMKTLREHQLSHDDSNLKFICAECGHRVRSAYKLKLHVKAKHPPKIRIDILEDSNLGCEKNCNTKNYVTSKVNEPSSSTRLSSISTRSCMTTHNGTTIKMEVDKGSKRNLSHLQGVTEIEDQKRLRVVLTRIKLEPSDSSF